MKKIMFLVVVCATFGTAKSQSSKVHPCPPGQCIVNVAYVLDVLNFHKPRTDCKSQFGFCIKGHMEYDCVDAGTSPAATNCNWESRYSTGLRVAGTKVYAGFIVVNDVLELHIPRALAATAEFANEDMSLFHVDDNAIAIQSRAGMVLGYLKGGAYIVTSSANDFIVKIPVVQSQ
jgi:hypothetical protein